MDLMDDECELTQQDILNTMKEYRRMFTLLGSAFSLLRQILPSNSDLQTLEKTIDEADKVWKKLGISCTPKAHGLFDGHTLEQHTRLRGIGDKGEDFVEKGHQLGLRDERRTWNIRNFEKQQRSQLKHIRRGNQAAVRSIIESVHQGSKRNLKRLENGGDSLQESRKRAKQEVKKDRREKALNDS
jgi:hypothetical protein